MRVSNPPDLQKCCSSEPAPDNAIPIEGWISDPTDYDLLNLIPLLEGLQYSTDVRALLTLRLGQPQMDAS
jgi:TFIIF-interacting CTD phosphatase-like protein